jgi:hypothetical protein
MSLPAQTLVETVKTQLVEDLTQARPLSAQVLLALNDTYSTAPDQFEDFVAKRLPELELYEVDVLFSPQFTPTLEQQAVYMRLLGVNCLEQRQLEQLLISLNETPLKTRFTLGQDKAEVPCPLHEAMLDRFVKRLNLSKAMMPDFDAAWLAAWPDEQRLQALSLLREEALHLPERQAIVASLLTLWVSQKPEYPLERLVFLLDSLRTYRPKTLDDLKRQMEALIQSCTDDADRAVERSYHSEELRMSNMGSKKDQLQAEQTRQHYQYMIRQAKEILANIDVLNPAVSA